MCRNRFLMTQARKYRGGQEGTCLPILFGKLGKNKVILEKIEVKNSCASQFLDLDNQVSPTKNPTYGPDSDDLSTKTITPDTFARTYMDLTFQIGTK